MTTEIMCIANAQCMTARVPDSVSIDDAKKYVLGQMGMPKIYILEVFETEDELNAE